MEYRVVTLTDGEMPQVATFEDAFGEFSEARGRGRKKRADRKRARQDKRKDKRKARQEKRMDRIKNRAARRSERRKMRTEATKDRLARRRMRKEERVARKGLGEEEYEEPMEEPMEDSMEEPMEEPTEEEGEYSEEGGEEYSEEEPMEESEEEYSEEESEEESGADGYYGFNAKTDNFDEYFTFVGDDFYNLDAITYDNNIYDIGEFSKGAEDYYSSADGTPSQINPKVAQITNKIEWNKEFIARLNKKMRSSRMGREEAAKLKKSLKNRQDALARLQQQLKNYSTIATKRKGAIETNKEIGKALNVSRYNRLKAIGGSRLGMSPEKALSKCMELNKRRAEMKETPVSSELNPEISQGRIVVPPSENTTASSSSCATGLTGVDDAYDYDSPSPRVYDVEFSNAAGDDAKKKKRNQIIAITAGVVVAGIIIYLIARKKK
jgi:hypothetical protein